MKCREGRELPVKRKNPCKQSNPTTASAPAAATAPATTPANDADETGNYFCDDNIDVEVDNVATDNAAAVASAVSPPKLPETQKQQQQI